MQILHCQFHGALQASEHLRRVHMRNMVMKYCRRVQPEWKKQVHLLYYRRHGLTCFLKKDIWLIVHLA